MYSLFAQEMVYEIMITEIANSLESLKIFKRCNIGSVKCGFILSHRYTGAMDAFQNLHEACSKLGHLALNSCQSPVPANTDNEESLARILRFVVLYWMHWLSS